MERGKNEVIERELRRLLDGAEFMAHELGITKDPNTGQPLSLAKALRLLIQYARLPAPGTAQPALTEQMQAPRAQGEGAEAGVLDDRARAPGQAQGHHPEGLNRRRLWDWGRALGLEMDACAGEMRRVAESRDAEEEASAAAGEEGLDAAVPTFVARFYRTALTELHQKYDALAKYRKDLNDTILELNSDSPRSPLQLPFFF